LWERLKKNLPPNIPSPLRRWALAATLLIFCQLILGATMRHQHAGLAIRDFPLAYGKWWPATDAVSVARYNAQRTEVTGANPITWFQIELQMAHRLTAVLVLLAVTAGAWTARRADAATARLAWAWLGLIVFQAALGAATVLTNKAADVATAHVVAGALSLAIGSLMCMITSLRRAGQSAESVVSELAPFAAHPATEQA